MGVYITTAFNNRAGDRYTCEVHIDGYSGAATEIRGAHDPLSLRTDNITWLVDRIQSTRAELRVLIRKPSIISYLCSQPTNSARLLVRKNNAPIWGGFFDAEGVEIPKDGSRGFICELRFGDFEPLKLRRYTPTGLISLDTAIRMTVGELGVPVKTDYAHLHTSPRDMYIDTSLLEEDSTLYDLLDLACQSTMSTVRQMGAISFRSPLRVRSKATPQLIKRWSASDSYEASSRIYNTIKYEIKSRGEKKRDNKVTGLSSSSKTATYPIEGGEVHGYYKTGRPSEYEHSYFKHNVSAYGYMGESESSFRYSSTIYDFIRGVKDMDYRTGSGKPLNKSMEELKDKARKRGGSVMITAESPVVSITGGAIEINATVGIDTPSAMVNEVVNDWGDSALLAIPAKIQLVDNLGAILQTYDGKKWISGNGATDALVWDKMGLISGGESNVDGNGNQGVNIPLPPSPPQQAKIRVSLLDGWLWGINNSPREVNGWAWLTFQTPLIALYEFAMQYSPITLGLFSINISQGVENSGEEQGLEVISYISDAVTEELEYQAIVGTHEHTPAWSYTKSGERFNRIERIGGDYAEHLLFKSLYPIYGVRGVMYSITADGDTTPDLYEVDDKELKRCIFTGGEWRVRENKSTIEMTEIKTDSYGGEKI